MLLFGEMFLLMPGFFLELLLWRHIGFCQKHFLHLPAWSYAKLAPAIKQKRNWCKEETWVGIEHESNMSYFVGSNLKSFSIPSQAPRCLIHPWVVLCKVRPQVPAIHLGKLQESDCNVVPFPRQSFQVLATPLVPLQSLALTRPSLTDYCVRLRFKVSSQRSRILLGQGSV